MPGFDFETLPDRLAWSAAKWEKYRGRDVIALWLADMDFAPPPPIREALAEHVAAGEYGYGTVPRNLPERLADDYRRRLGWIIDPAWIVWLPGLVPGLNLAVKTCCAEAGAAVSFSPVYPPFLGAPGLQGRRLVEVPLKASAVPGHPTRLDYAIDFAALTAALDGSPDASLLLLCHPHNPIGRAFSADELDRLASLCEQRDLHVCSDEVHGDLLLDGERRHQPFAARLGEQRPRLFSRSITLDGPGKTYNIPGLGVAWAIVPDAPLRRRFRGAMQRLVPEVGVFGFTALAAALQHGEPWRRALIEQLRLHRDRVDAALERMQLPHTRPEAGYLTWIDARALAAAHGNPAAFFERHGVGLSDGADFGQPGFVRLNFATPPARLDQALRRMEAAVRS